MKADKKKFYEVGKILGLTKKDITQTLIFDNSKNAYLWRFLLIVVNSYKKNLDSGIVY